MSARDYALDYTALETGWATQGAADYCTANGHATHRVDGVDTGICPRCLAVTEVYVSDEGDQGYGEWLESIEEGVSATLKARAYKHPAVSEIPFTVSEVQARQAEAKTFAESVSDIWNANRVQAPEPIEGQDAARGILAVNPEPEGSDIWHAWGLGFEYAEQTGGVYDSPLSGEWADCPTPHAIVAKVMRLMGFETSDCEEGQDAEIADAFELGYATYVAGWRI